MQEHEQEVNLSDYVKVILKRKKTIFLIFLATTIAAAIISFLMPKSYEISMIIEPSLEITKGNKQLYLDSPKNIAAKIRGEAFNLSVLRISNVDPGRKKLSLKVTQPKDSTLVKISIEEPKSKIDTGVRLLNNLFIKMTETYQSHIDYKKEMFTKEAAVVSNIIESKKDSIALREKELKILEEREASLLGELKIVKENSEKLIAQRDALLIDKTNKNGMSSLLYSNVVQQNISYFSTLSDQLMSLKSRKENLLNEIECLNKDIENLKTQIDTIGLQKNQIQNIKFVQKPQALPFPVRPKKMKNIAVAGILGLFLGVFIAFFREFWEKEMKNG
ncbi:MAG: hypothetical protein ISS92_00215 [Candidatus Omnitrophica bacterium]|nr:hypothetical protein [Candidatus Omnitrophota bacterium]